MRSDWPTPEQIIPLLEPILKHQPDGLSEYALLNQLAAQHAFFSDSGRNDGSAKNELPSRDLNLFQRHFLLFHCLYLLAQQYRADQSGLLSISALEIRLHPYPTNRQQAAQSLATTDPVRDYYLDITQLQTTGEDEIDEMLGKFWLALARHDVRDKTLALLGLTDPVDDLAIRKRYREKVMQHHPDRGGDLEAIQQLNVAISKLLPKSP